MYEPPVVAKVQPVGEMLVGVQPIGSQVCNPAWADDEPAAPADAD